MFKHFCVAAAACFLLGQCAGTAVKIMPGYKKMNVEKLKLGIILLRENLAIANPDNIADDFGAGETKQVFCDFFTSELREFAEQDGKFAEVNVISGCDTSGFTTIPENLSSGNPVSMRVPARRAFISDSLAYLLILDYFDVSREKKLGKTVVVMGMYGTPAPRRTGDSDKLILRGTFVLWDNLAGKMAAFGQINEKSDVLFGMTKNTWITIVKNISSNIFTNQPYGISTAAPE
jgi:hypothetical protein